MADFGKTFSRRKLFFNILQENEINFRKMILSHYCLHYGPPKAREERVFKWAAGGNNLPNVSCDLPDVVKSFWKILSLRKLVPFVSWKLTEFPIWLHIFKFLLNNTRFQSSYLSEMSSENWKANLIWLYNKSMNIKVLINFTNVNDITITFKERP